MKTKTPDPKTNARIAGVLFLAAIVTYATGNGLVHALLASPDALASVAAHRTQLGVGALLMLANSLAVVSIGVVLLPILESHSKVVAFGYLSARLIEAIMLSVGVVSLLSVPLSQDTINVPGAFQASCALALQHNMFAYQVAMIALGMGSLMFCRLLFQTRLIPRSLAACGLIGYAVFLIGAVLEILGFAGIGIVCSVPGGLFELVFGGWLVVRGFNTAS